MTTGDPLEPHERQGLTIWGEHLGAQVATWGRLDGSSYEALHLHLDRAPLDNGSRVLELPDILKLRALLNEAAERYGWDRR